ncbi:hypothetical protein BCAR13_410059 [Paraburkholderia caribensis]|nr:hypothetical protein BCAR13_410059 [Paraburkholderia caribensis]
MSGWNRLRKAVKDACRGSFFALRPCEHADAGLRLEDYLIACGLFLALVIPLCAIVVVLLLGS